MPALRSAVAAVDPLLPIGGVQTIEELRADQLSNRRLPLQLVTGFSLLAVVLAALGIYGVGAHLVVSRRRELGVRMALGATASRVQRLVMRDGLATVFAGLLVGIPLALLLGGQMGALLYQVKPFDPLTIVAVVALLAIVGAVATAIPAYRASKVDPLRVLRQD